MKKYNKICLLILLMSSALVYSQQLSKRENLKFQNFEKNKNLYQNKTFEDLLKDLPEIKMLRIMPNNPQINIHTFIIGFLKNSEFNKSSDKKRVTLYINGKINKQNISKEDLTTSEAIKKYGNLKVAAIL